MYCVFFPKCQTIPLNLYLVIHVCFYCYIVIHKSIAYPNICFFSFLFSSSPLSPSQEEKSADVCQEKPDLRFRYGFHHQCHAYRSQSDAAEWNGVTNCTVSMGSGQNSHDLTSCLCSQSWTSHNPSTSLNNQLCYLFSFNLNLPYRGRQCE